jgi:hypothetical protein
MYRDAADAKYAAMILNFTEVLRRTTVILRTAAFSVEVLTP